MTAVMRKIRKLFELSAEDRRCLLLAWWGLLAIDLALRIRPSWVMPGPADPGPRIPAPADGSRGPKIATCVRAVQRAAHHHVVPMTCLRRALCLRWLLGRRGIPSRLCLGVQREGGPLAAHAWLEDPAGRPLGEPVARRDAYAALETGKT